MATGSGKTITSIYGAVKIYESLRNRGRGLCLTIAVPYIELAKQWVENLLDFGISCHKCYNSRSSWLPNLEESVTAFNIGAKDFICMVVVNRTLSSSHYQTAISNINPFPIPNGADKKIIPYDIALVLSPGLIHQFHLRHCRGRRARP